MIRTKINRSIGFTLIELLVVIAIIAILAAILFPVFASAREKARQSADSSNLKQIGIAFLQYEQDYDEYFPFSVTERYAPSSNYGVDGGSLNSCNSPTYVGDGVVAADFSIRGLLQPYVKSSGVWHDPSQTTNWAWDGPANPPSAADTATADGLSSKKAWFQADYGFNFDESVWDTSGYNGSGVDGYGNTGSSAAAQVCVPHAVDFETGNIDFGVGFNGKYNQSKISAPTTFILGSDTLRYGPSVSRGSVTPQPALLADGKTYYPNWPPVPTGITAPSNWPDTTQASIQLRHAGKANFLFGDGHVKLLLPEQTIFYNGSTLVNYWLRQQ